jgi:hypothetical protein
MILPSRDEVAARRARLGAPIAPRSLVVLAPAPKKLPPPVNLPKLLSKFRLRVDIRPTKPTMNAYLEQAYLRKKEADRNTVKRIIAEVADKYDLGVSELLANRRVRVSVEPRQEAMWRARNETALSLTELAHCFGRKEHTTILHAIRCHEARRDGGVYRKGRG